MFYGAIIVFLIFMIMGFSLYSTSDRNNITGVVFMRFFFNLMSFWVLGWAVLFGYKGVWKLILENRIVVYLGKISYGMYLYHLFVPTLIFNICSHFKIKVDFLSSTSTFSSWATIIIYIFIYEFSRWISKWNNFDNLIFWFY